MSKEVMAKAKAHFREIMSGDMQSYRVDEWDETIYYKAGTNFQQESKVIELQNQGKTAEALVQVLINKALDKDGTKIFTDASRPELMTAVDPKVILRIVNEINKADTVSVEDAGKN